MRSVAGLVAALVALAAAGPAAASEPLADTNVRSPSLAVNRAGEALITYTANGKVRRVLVWGAINARHPSPTVPQVQFEYDYAGGWGKYRKLVWKSFTNACKRYDGPSFPYLVVGCKAPDGSYWALQSWQRNLPLLGFDPWLPAQRAYELHVSHWRGPVAELEAYANWTHGGDLQGIFGRLTYLGEPVYGFGSTRTGNPTDRYARNVYIDTRNSSYGPGWKRESGILTHGRTGTFCHSFTAQTPFPGYPSREIRPPAPGDRYRITVMGPGVTPVIQWERPGLGAFDESSDAVVNAAFDRLMAGDRICASER